MKKALISPNEKIMYISGWDTTKSPNEAIISFAPDLVRIAEICDNSFEVAAPLFWVDCDDEVSVETHAYNEATNQIVLKLENQPQPQPVTQGTQTL